MIEAAIAEAVVRLQKDRHKSVIEEQTEALNRVEGEIRQLTNAIASGGHLSSLLEALQVRETARDSLQQEVRAAQEAQQAADTSPADLRARLLTRLADWRQLLRGQVTQGQQIIRRLLVGPLVCAPTDDRRYRISGTATIGKLVEGWVPLMVASPICASWNQLEGWLRAVDGLRLAA